MKKLIIVRHAKSSWKDGVKDHDRGLEPRGVRDAKLVSLNFKQFNFMPDQVYSSTAKRAKKTSEIFLDKLNIGSNLIQFDKNLYDFSGENLIQTIKNTNNNIQTLMVFGHNEAITNFVNMFGDRYIDNVPTSGLVVIEFHVDSWKYIYKGETVKILFPRDLR
ncbi:SixA phosphatase family protein [Xanthomarina sp. F2636L]|uniref:SixA phosphatase family protein n=1 Tax=Xanthomarina sp. F2636L TaxID=2996018 RepID=UPI00225E127A|nr:histidine phosphatase family protein [Xanthomarina sp. F2636L]MCX7549419.1 histidine phosphatase family protein [Xanthomarina sp. F2636L]